MKISSYDNDSSLSVQDKLIGTNELGETKNYSIDQIAQFIQENILLEQTNEFDSIFINNIPEVEPELSPGTLRWNETDGTIELRLKGNNVTLQLGQETVLRVVNKTGSLLSQSSYKAVRASGAQGQRVGVELAMADSSENCSTTIGLITEDIPNNSEGFITTEGTIRDINTTGDLFGETWFDGDVLYLSQSEAGGITNVMPESGCKIIIGYVEYAHGVEGKIYVKISNATFSDSVSFGDLSDVTLDGISDGSIPYYDLSSGQWKNGKLFRVLVGTPTKGFEPPPPVSGNVLIMYAPYLPTYTDDAAASAGGLDKNQIYKTATGELRIVISS